MNVFKVFEDESVFSLGLQSFINGNHQIEIPVLIKNRNDLLNSIEQSKEIYHSCKTPNKVELGIRISSPDSIEILSPFERAFAKEWIHISEVTNLDFDRKSIVVMGLYEDFKHKKLKEFIFKCFQLNIQVSYLIGRDISSLSWLCAKQFLQKEENLDNGLFTHRKINRKIQQDILGKAKELKIFDKPLLKKMDIQQELLEQNWGRLILHGHGKEDNINFEEYTICGRNESVVHSISILPRCGYCNQSCFKNDDKLIPLNKVKASNIIMASCNNGPFSDLALYDDKYNLLLNAIDGIAQNITAAMTIQDADLQELERLVDFSNPDWNPARIINDSLKFSQPFPSMIEIGLPVTKTSMHIDYIEPSERIVNAIERAQKYYVNDFLEPDHSLKKILPNFINKGNQYLLRGQYGLNIKEKTNIENNWKQKIQALNDIIADLILKDSGDPLLDFDGYNVYRSKVDYNSIKPITCQCGNEGLSFNYKGNSSHIFDLEMEFCYRCGDKSLGMLGGPNLSVNATTNLKVGEEIKGICKITPKEEGEILFGWFVPGYIEEYSVNRPTITRFKNRNKEEISVDFNIAFSNDIPAQGYYLTVFTVQNLAITFSRHFFTLEGELHENLEIQV
ncbi:hypothetical protein P4483_23225 [Bacillus thuringiensis]|nr:hypothetical protein [Bacillus thuringiensis]